MRCTRKAVADPSSLSVVDEADRRRMTSLEQLRATVDEGLRRTHPDRHAGTEQRVARFPQLYSRVGFVHEVRPLERTEIETMLDRHWFPRGVHPRMSR